MSEQKAKLSRHELAHLEIGQTAIAPWLSRCLVVVFLATVFSVPVVQHVHEIGSRLPQCYDIFGSVPKAGGIVLGGDGSLTRRIFKANSRLLFDINEYEDELEERSLLSEWLLPHTQELVTRWLGVGNEKAYCGRGKWLFYRPGIEYLTGLGFLDAKQLAKRADSGNKWTPAPQPDPVAAIIDFREQLAARGIDLILMPTPVKPMIYPEKFSRRFDSQVGALQNPSYDVFLTRLAEAGVTVFDVAQALMGAGQDLYLQTDTHWTPLAVELAARGLAALVRERVELAEASSVQYSRRSAEVENVGDIALMLRLPEDQRLYEPQAVTIRQVLTPAGGLWEADVNAEVLLLGDSFSNVYSLGGLNWGEGAGLAEQLSFRLQRPLDRIVRNDAGAYATRQILSRELAQGRDRLAGKKLVIWQFASRELAVGDWKLIEMRRGQEQKPVARPTSDSELVVQGKINAIERVPKPGTVPYKDCITSIHLTELAAISGTFAEAEALVFVWGMRDNKWTAAARYKVGQALKLRLVPWRQVEKKYGSYNRIEPDDDELLLLEPYWGEVCE